MQSLMHNGFVEGCHEGTSSRDSVLWLFLRVSRGSWAPPVPDVPTGAPADAGYSARGPVCPSPHFP